MLPCSNYLSQYTFLQTTVIPLPIKLDKIGKVARGYARGHYLEMVGGSIFSTKFAWFSVPLNASQLHYTLRAHYVYTVSTLWEHNLPLSLLSLFSMLLVPW